LVCFQKISADVKNIRRLFLAASEVEFEWLRQFYIQGQKHHDLHRWWHKPMEEFKQGLLQIDQRIVKICKILVESAGDLLVVPNLVRVLNFLFKRTNFKADNSRTTIVKG
jgi:hypothetical protein